MASKQLLRIPVWNLISPWSKNREGGFLNLPFIKVPEIMQLVQSVAILHETMMTKQDAPPTLQGISSNLASSTSIAVLAHSELSANLDGFLD